MFRTHHSLGNGTLKLQVAYHNMGNEKSVDFNRWFVALEYDYPISKHTSLFAMSGFSQKKSKTQPEMPRRETLNSHQALSIVFSPSCRR